MSQISGHQPLQPSHSEIVEFTRNWQKGISRWQSRASASPLPRICQFFSPGTAVDNTMIIALWDEVWCSSPRKRFHFDNLAQFTGISMEMIKAYMCNHLDSLTLLTQSSVCKKALDNASTQTFLTKAHTLVSDMYFIIILLNACVCILMILLWCSMLIKITQKLLKCSPTQDEIIWFFVDLSWQEIKKPKIDSLWCSFSDMPAGLGGTQMTGDSDLSDI